MPGSARILDEDLEAFRATVCEIGGRVEAALGESVEALLRGDEDLARAVIAGDGRIDGLAAAAEQEAVCLIALRAPLAGDLREVLAAFKIVGLLARMGDCARNVAHRALLLSGCRKLQQLRIVPAMAEAVSAMVKDALDAFVRRDAAVARRVIEADDRVDELHAALFRAIVDHVRAHPHSAREAAHLMFVGQKLERIGDHAAAIAGIVAACAPGDEAEAVAA